MVETFVYHVILMELLQKHYLIVTTLLSLIL